MIKEKQYLISFTAGEKRYSFHAMIDTKVIHTPFYKDAIISLISKHKMEYKINAITDINSIEVK
jgi:hypothetical protein